MRSDTLSSHYGELFDALLDALRVERLPGLRVLRSDSGNGWDVADAIIGPGSESTIRFEADPATRRPLVSSGNLFYAEELVLLETEHLIPAAPVLIPVRREWLPLVLAALPVRNWDYVSRHPGLLTVYQQLEILEGLL
jgi:hypothetical protein